MKLIYVLMDHSLCVRVEQIDLMLVNAFGHAAETFKSWTHRFFIGMFCANCSQNYRFEFAFVAIKRVVFGDALKRWLRSSFVIRLSYSGIFFMDQFDH